MSNESNNDADRRCLPRLVRWEFVDEPGELFKWELRRPDGTSAATVWENGVWHTWSPDGSGGENSAQDCVTNAQMEAVLSAINQGFFSANDEVRDRDDPSRETTN